MNVKTAAPGQAAPEQAITLLRDAALRLSAHTRDAEAQAVRSRIYNYLARLPEHFVTEYLEHRKDGSVVVNRVDLGDWPRWATTAGLAIDRGAPKLELDVMPVVTPPRDPIDPTYSGPTLEDCKARLPSVQAKPIEWAAAEDDPTEWMGGAWGFLIRQDPDEPEDGLRFIAEWGEGDSDSFATLDEAKAWCQSLAQTYVERVAQVAP